MIDAPAGPWHLDRDHWMAQGLIAFWPLNDSAVRNVVTGESGCTVAGTPQFYVPDGESGALGVQTATNGQAIVVSETFAAIDVPISIIVAGTRRSGTTDYAGWAIRRSGGQFVGLLEDFADGDKLSTAWLGTGFALGTKPANVYNKWQVVGGEFYQSSTSYGSHRWCHSGTLDRTTQDNIHTAGAESLNGVNLFREPGVSTRTQFGTWNYVAIYARNFSDSERDAFWQPDTRWAMLWRRRKTYFVPAAAPAGFHPAWAARSTVTIQPGVAA